MAIEDDACTSTVRFPQFATENGQPEVLGACCSAMVNTAKEEPDGLGSLAEETALAGRFFVPKGQNVTDPGHEQLLLRATVKELVRRDGSLDRR